MKAKEIKVGGLYTAKVSQKLTVVKVDKIDEQYTGKVYRTIYRVTNTRTGRKTTFRSPQRFREEVSTKGMTLTWNYALNAVEIYEEGKSTPIARYGVSIHGLHGAYGKCLDLCRARGVEPTISKILREGLDRADSALIKMAYGK